MSAKPGSAERFEAAGSDLDDARELYREAYRIGRMTVEPTAAEFGYRFTSTGDDDLSLRASQVEGRITGASFTQGEYVVSWMTRGEGVSDLLGSPMKFLHGQPAMFANDRPAQFDLIDYRLNMMHFGGAYLEGVAAETEGSVGPIRFDTTFRPSGDALRRWTETVATVARVVYDDGSSALLRAEANRAAAVTLLEVFPHVALQPRSDLAVPSGGKTRAAVEFMIANAHRPMGTDEIAAAAGISLRSLQAAFRREYGVTATDYLRSIRLDRVRQELRDAEPGLATVAEVARRWGFTHLGRFAASYTTRFGEYPSVTLASSRGATHLRSRG
ncbi:Helix-turn-helix domain-containing protein [Plantibacter flavus]|uniref:Helix-turn-helix protein n=1 Tax=Plantibacter flavus TaxID=150123 RepID=A0A3N2C7S8_9MICO|nr:helix-turn-helix transcriptional regulator [Plantibacter flavus]ROR83562.1 helix-turn-helix protein [Plantibacter flavus]SMG24913.1 Helix-turn-helix domain-containing protein [Plantibacter flavus]